MATPQTITRWESEARFFDRVAELQANEILPIDPLAIRRYGARPLRSRFREEFRFRVAKSLQGKRVLDVGCGDGSNSVLLARLGAQVVGVDVSPKSIALAEKRARISGVGSSIRLICSPLEEARIEPHSFDLIWGDAILHHLIEKLDLVMSLLTLWARPGAMMVFSEPVNFNHTLRRLRLKLPVKTDATPDERPLEPAELAVIRRFLPDLRIRFFSLFGRLNRFILLRFNYERSSAIRRGLASLFAAIDYGLLSLPGIRNLGGYVVIYGRSAASGAADATGWSCLNSKPD